MTSATTEARGERLIEETASEELQDERLRLLGLGTGGHLPVELGLRVERIEREREGRTALVTTV